MTNVTIFKSKDAVTSTSPRELSDFAKSLSTGGTTSRRIQTNTNGTFKRIINGEQIGNAVRGEINVIIIHALQKVSRIYYAAKFDPNKEATLPDCWSNLGDMPEIGAANPQSNSCAACPQNVIGSGKHGKGKACRYSRRIAVLAEGDPTGEVYQMNIPAKSLFGNGVGNVHPYEKYQNYLRSNNEGLDTVVTQVAFDTEADSMVLNFKAIRHLTQGEVDMLDAAQADPETQKYIQLTTDANKALPAPAPAAKPVSVFDEPEEEAEEVKPVKRAAKKEEAPAPKKNLADVVSAWGDEED